MTEHGLESKRAKTLDKMHTNMVYFSPLTVSVSVPLQPKIMFT